MNLTILNCWQTAFRSCEFPDAVFIGLFFGITDLYNPRGFKSYKLGKTIVMFYKGVTIGLDFDGTVVTHEFPKIGKDVPYCIETLKRITEEGGKIVLITMRTGKRLAEAVSYLNYHDIPLYGVNCNPRQEHYSRSPKIYANIYIDDAALGCPLIHNDLSDKAYVDWQQVQKHLFPRQGENQIKGALMEEPVYDDVIVDYKQSKFANFFTNVFSKFDFS